jgi:hypothetical protein
MSDTDEDPNIPLPPYLIKNLLEDIENCAQSLQHINFISICNQNPRIYGSPASIKRRKFQKKFGKLKEKSPDSYQRYLSHYHVRPGSQTNIRLFQLAEQQAEQQAQVNGSRTGIQLTPPTGQRVQENASEEDEDDYSNMLSDDDDDEMLADSFKKHVTILTSPTRNNPLSTPPRRGAVAPSSPPRYSIAGASSTPSAPSSASGTKENPYIIRVNTTYPERNQDFSISWVPSMIKDSFSYSGFHIRRSVPVLDYDRWEAALPKEGEYPAHLDFRLVLIKGPSQNVWFRDSDQYHASLQCFATKNVHKATGIAIEKDESRHHSYWLLEFPKGVVLDNKIFSEDPYDVKASWNRLTSSAKQNPTKLDLRGMVLMWQIAEIGGQRITKKGTDKPDAESLFK